jgi:predicted RNase H-like nuclease (RuvC/YqgF family)
MSGDDGGLDTEARLLRIEAMLATFPEGSAVMRALVADMRRIEEALERLERDEERRMESIAATAERMEAASLEQVRDLERAVTEQRQYCAALTETNRELREFIDVLFARVALLGRTVETSRWRLEPISPERGAESQPLTAPKEGR